MPTAQRALSPADIHTYVRRHCLDPAAGGRVGVELELLALDATDPACRPSPVALQAALADLELPYGSRITVEPGGQVEISSRPLPGPGPAIDATAADLHCLRSRLDGMGIRTASLGLDPARPYERVTAGPRYAAMEAYFDADADGGAGRAMMCGTASVQVNLDLGDADTLGPRWRLAHALGPVLVAAFAHSPLAAGRATGARSCRQQIWSALDPTRSAPVAGAAGSQHLSPADAWARYAVAARVMLVRTSPDRIHPVLEHLPFGAWMADGHRLGYPTLDDFAYHLTTLFPPVRPKGWLELRMIDAVPDPWWQVAVAVATVLLDDAQAFEVAERACRPVADLWAEAAADGLSHPGLASAARTCFAAAAEALPRAGVGPGTIAATEAFVDRYVDRARCPADDILDAWALTVGATPRG